MSRFIHVDTPSTHGGVVRFERGFGAVRQSLRGLIGARGTATMLLAAIVSALLVVANELVDSWTEGHLLAAWVMMWAIGFAALALLAEPARNLATNLREAVRNWNASRAQSAADDRLWEVALTDARIMADLSRAMSQAAERELKAYY